MNHAWPILKGGQIVGYQLTSPQRFAIEKALRDDWKAADSLELQYLATHVKPHAEDGVVTMYAKFVPVRIIRGGGPNGEDVAEWEFDYDTYWGRPAIVTDLDGFILRDET